MAIKEFTFTTANGGTNVPPRYHVCDTEAELPGSATDGSLAYSVDTDKIFVRSSGSWEEFTLGGGGGGGGMSADTVEVDLGSTPVFRGKFTITDAAIGATDKVLCWQAPGPYTGKGTRADEAEIQPVNIISVVPAAGSAVVHWETPPIVVFNRNPRATIGQNTGASNSNTVKDMQDIAGGYMIRLGKVRGNVKFSYAIFG